MGNRKSPPKLDMFGDPGRFKEIEAYYTDPEIQHYIYKLNEKYVHWDEVRHYKNHPKGIRAEAVWLLLKLSRMFQYRNISIHDSFNYILTDSILKSLHELDQETSGTLESKEDSFAQGANLERYLINSIMEEAIASSQLEGAATSRRVAKEMLRSGKKPRDESQQMIVNAYKTMLFLKEAKGQPLTKELICKIQAKMTEGTLEEKYIGRFRDNNEVNVVSSGSGEIIYHPPNYEKIPDMIDALCKFANSKDKTFFHPILKAIVLHFMIGYIHPFENGNGRTARALFYWHVLAQGYWLFEYMPISRAIKNAPGKYSRAYTYTENDGNDLTYFIVFNLRQLKIALDGFRDYIKLKKKESERVKGIMRDDPAINFRQSDIILRFMKTPIKRFSIAEIRQIYSVAYQTARTDLDLLAGRGYIEKRKEGKKFTYSFSEHQSHHSKQ